MRLILVVLPSEFTVDVRVCVVLLDLGFVAFIFCRVLRELENIVVVALGGCALGATRCNILQAVRGSMVSPLLLVIRLCFLLTDNRSTNIRKNPHEQYFSDGVFCFVNQS